MTPRPSGPYLSGARAAAGRRLDCAHTGVCLDLAIARDWEAYSCGACTSFALPSPEERAADLEGLLELAAVLATGRPTRTSAAASGQETP